MEPFEVVVVDLSEQSCEGCGGGLCDDLEVVGSIDALGRYKLWHEHCAPADVRRLLLWQRSSEKAWLN